MLFRILRITHNDSVSIHTLMLAHTHWYCFAINLHIILGRHRYNQTYSLTCHHISIHNQRDHHARAIHYYPISPILRILSKWMHFLQRSEQFLRALPLQRQLLRFSLSKPQSKHDIHQRRNHQSHQCHQDLLDYLRSRESSSNPQHEGRTPALHRPSRTRWWIHSIHANYLRLSVQFLQLLWHRGAWLFHHLERR